MDRREAIKELTFMYALCTFNPEKDWHENKYMQRSAEALLIAIDAIKREQEENVLD